MMQSTAASATSRRALFEDEHQTFRESFRRFLEQEVVPRYPEWQQAGHVPRDLFRAAAEHGFIGMQVPEDLGGAGVDDIRFNVVIGEEAMRAGVAGFGRALAVHNDVCVPILLRHAVDAKRLQWAGGAATGELLATAAVQDPAAVRGEAASQGWALRGTASCVVNAADADLVIVAARTTGDRREDLLVAAIERGAGGLRVDPDVKLIGLRGCGMADLHLDGVEVESDAVLAAPGEGRVLDEIARSEQFSLAIAGVAGARAALGMTLDYVRDRKVFGQPLATFENTRLALADVAAELEATEAFVDVCIREHAVGGLSSPRVAAAKLRAAELYGRAVDCGVQLHGGYGYMLEYPIAHAYADARWFRLLGGTSEAVKATVADALGLSSDT
jgi:alkylation response protein AidB-like acyl-CoA dehydrogenase